MPSTRFRTWMRYLKEWGSDKETRILHDLILAEFLSGSLKRSGVAETYRSNANNVGTPTCAEIDSLTVLYKDVQSERWDKHCTG